VVDAFYAEFGIEKDDVDRELHAECVDGLRGKNPQAFAGLKLLVPGQADPPCARRIRDLNVRREENTSIGIPNGKSPYVQSSFEALRFRRRRMRTISTSAAAPAIIRMVVVLSAGAPPSGAA
jgi:hypothetical protein